MKEKSQRRKKRKTSTIVIQIIVGAFIGIIIGFLSGFYGFDSIFEDKFTTSEVLLFLLFIIIGGFIQINIHEFGHFIFGKFFGYKLISYRIGAFTWNNENGRMKFAFIKNKGYSGLCAMIPPEKALPAYKEILYFSGGILLNIGTGVGFIVLSYILPGIPYIVKSFLLASGCIGIVLGLTNFVPFISLNNPSDGKIIWSKLLKSPFAEKMVELNKMASQLTAGMRPGDMDIPSVTEVDEPQAFDLSIMLFAYFKALDNNNTEDMKRYIDLLEKNINYFPSPALPALYYEICFMACITGDESKARAYYEKGGKILQRDKDINGLRIKAYYEYNVIGDDSTAAELCKSALAVADKYPMKGQSLLEESLVKKLLEQIEQS